MPRVISGNSTVFPTDIRVPSDGDRRSANSVSGNPLAPDDPSDIVGFQGLASRTAWLRAVAVGADDLPTFANDLIAGVGRIQTTILESVIRALATADMVAGAVLQVLPFGGETIEPGLWTWDQDLAVAEDHRYVVQPSDQSGNPATPGRWVHVLYYQRAKVYGLAALDAAPGSAQGPLVIQKPRCLRTYVNQDALRAEADYAPGGVGGDVVVIHGIGTYGFVDSETANDDNIYILRPSTGPSHTGPGRWVSTVRAFRYPLSRTAPAFSPSCNAYANNNTTAALVDSGGGHALSLSYASSGGPIVISLVADGTTNPCYVHPFGSDELTLILRADGMDKFFFTYAGDAGYGGLLQPNVNQIYVPGDTATHTYEVYAKTATGGLGVAYGIGYYKLALWEI